MSKLVNITVAGLGGQGVLKVTDILAEVAFRAGHDVKKSEVHGMSQRGGSVSSEVRYGKKVHSPMIPEGESDFLLVIEPTQVEVNRARLKEGGVLIDPAEVDMGGLENAKAANILLLGVLSKYLDFDRALFLSVIKENLPEKVHAVNEKAFDLGRNSR